jgi:hypothetical protein
MHSMLCAGLRWVPEAQSCQLQDLLEDQACTKWSSRPPFSILNPLTSIYALWRSTPSTSWRGTGDVKQDQQAYCVRSKRLHASILFLGDSTDFIALNAACKVIFKGFDPPTQWECRHGGDCINDRNDLHTCNGSRQAGAALRFAWYAHPTAWDMKRPATTSCISAGC